MKIVRENGYTKVYDENGKEIKNIKSIKFQHAGIDSIPIVTIEKYEPIYEIKGEDIEIATLDKPSYTKGKIPFICQGERCGSKEILNKQEIINRIAELLEVNKVERIEVALKELAEDKTPNISVEIGGKELINKANTIILNGNVIAKKELAEDESINSKTIQSPQEIISKTISETLTDDVIVKKELAEMKEILSKLLEIQNAEFNMKYGYLCNNKSGRISSR